MNVSIRHVATTLCVLLLIFAVAGMAGCADDAADEEPAEVTQVEGDGGEEGGEEVEPASDDGADSSAGEADEAELRDGAQDIAQAWFVGPGSDLTADDVEFSVETLLQSGDGSWWARVSATPHDTSMETEQIYVTLPAGMELWQPIDSGTGIDPPTDDRFPEDIRGQL